MGSRVEYDLSLRALHVFFLFVFCFLCVLVFALGLVCARRACCWFRPWGGLRRGWLRVRFCASSLVLLSEISLASTPTSLSSLRSFPSAKMSLFARTARSTIQRNVRKFADMKDAPKVNFFPAEVSYAELHSHCTALHCTALHCVADTRVVSPALVFRRVCAFDAFVPASLCTAFH